CSLKLVEGIIWLRQRLQESSLCVCACVCISLSGRRDPLGWGGHLPWGAREREKNTQRLLAFHCARPPGMSMCVCVRVFVCVCVCMCVSFQGRAYLSCRRLPWQGALRGYSGVK